MSSQPIKKKKKKNITIYMSQQIKTKYYKIPLRSVKNITEQNYKQQKMPNVLSKEFREDKDNGFNNICFTNEYQLPTTDFNTIVRFVERENLLTKKIEKKPVYSQKLGEDKYTLGTNEGYGVLTGSKNKLSVLDLDTENWTNENKFIKYCCDKLKLEIKENVKDTIIDIVKKINTYTVQTPRGGFHLYFHNDKAQNMKNSSNSIENVDIRGEGGYVVGAYSQLKKPDGSIVEYKPYIDKELLDINDKTNMDFIDLFDEMKTGNNKSKKKNNNLRKSYKNRPTNLNLYEFLITDKQLDIIEKALPDTFFIDFMEWKKITLFYAIINREDRWDEICYAKRLVSGVNKYNKNKNDFYFKQAFNKLYDYPMVEYVLKECGLLEYLPYIRYKKIPENIIEPDEIFNMKRVSDYFYEDTLTGIYDCIFKKNELEGQNLVIKSGTATGKSYLFKYYHSVRLDCNTPVMSIVSRVSLGDEHNRIFTQYNNDLYSPCEEEDGILIENPNYHYLYVKDRKNFDKLINIKYEINDLWIEYKKIQREKWDISLKKEDIKKLNKQLKKIYKKIQNKYLEAIGEHTFKKYYLRTKKNYKKLSIGAIKENISIEIIKLENEEGDIQEQNKQLTVGEIKNYKNRKYFSYNHLSKNDSIKHYRGNNIIIQVDSLLKLREWTNEDFGEYCIFIDEFNSVFEYLWESGTLKNNRRNVLKLFSKIIKNAKQVIMADADITDTALMFLNLKYWEKCGINLTEEEINTFNIICPNLEFKFIENKHKHYEGVESEELFNYTTFVEHLCKLDKFMVCCDSALECSKLKTKLVELGLEENDITVISAKTTVVDKNLDRYYKVIFSPSIVYGLDSQMKREVFCIFTENSISSRGMLQQVARCRNISKLWYYFPNKNEFGAKEFKFNNENEVIGRVMSLDNYSTNKYKEIIKEIVLSENMNIEELYNECDILNNTNNICNSFFINLLNRMIYKEDCDSSNRFLHFKLGLRRLGTNDKDDMKPTQKRNRAEQNRLKELVEEEIEEKFINNLHSENVKELNKILKLPNEEDKIEFKDIFCKTGAFEKHIAFCNLFLEDSKSVSKKLNDNYENEFGVHLSKTTLTKVNFIKGIWDKIDLVEDNLYGNIELSKKEANDLYDKYCLLWEKPKDKDNPLQEKYSLSMFLKSVITKLIGFCPYKSTAIKTYIYDKETKSKKRVSRRDYSLDKSNVDFEYHSKLKSFRNENNQDICYIE